MLMGFVFKKIRELLDAVESEWEKDPDLTIESAQRKTVIITSNFIVTIEKKD